MSSDVAGSVRFTYRYRAAYSTKPDSVIECARGLKRRGVEKRVQTMLRSELDPLAHHIQELAHRQVAGHQVLGLVKVRHR